MSRPAPGRLEVVRDFLNTVSIERGTDDIADPGSYRRWLAGAGLGTPDISERGLRRAAALRDDLRAVVATHSKPLETTTELTGTWVGLQQLPLRLNVSDDGSIALAPATCDLEDTVLADLLCVVAEAAVNGSWRRVKLCQRPTCRWAFYDASPARSATWCTMQVCGARHKASAYRRRHTEAR